jgi:hypothetical protein
MPDDHDPMDIDEDLPIQKSKGDPFTRVWNEYKTGTATSAKNSASLYGDREAFNSIVQSKKSVKGTTGRIAGMTGTGQTLNPTKKDVPKPVKHTTSRPTLQVAGPPNSVNVLAHKIQVAAMVKQAFEGKEYEAGPSPLPSRDINGKKIAAGSKEATL